MSGEVWHWVDGRMEVLPLGETGQVIEIVHPLHDMWCFDDDFEDDG